MFRKKKRFDIPAVRPSGISMANRFPDVDGHHPRFLIDGFQFFVLLFLNGYDPPLAWVIPVGYRLRPSVLMRTMIPSLYDCEGTCRALTADIENVGRRVVDNMQKNLEEKEHFQI
jgi:hypothetical protein